MFLIAKKCDMKNIPVPVRLKKTILPIYFNFKGDILYIKTLYMLRNVFAILSIIQEITKYNCLSQS